MWWAAAAQIGAQHMQQDAQAKAQAEAMKGNKAEQKFQQEAYYRQQAQMAPWRNYGVGALGKLANYYGLGGTPMTGMGGGEDLYTYKDKQIQNWLDANPDDPRYQQVYDKFMGGQTAPQAPPGSFTQSGRPLGGTRGYGLPAPQQPLNIWKSQTPQQNPYGLPMMGRF